MPEELEDLGERLDLPLFLELDLCVHEGEFLASFMRAEISANVDELNSGFLNLVLSDEHSR